MRQTIKNYIEAAKQRRENGEEAGFSLVELIVVVVILGVLAAVAIPIFSNIQGQAEKSAADAAAANAASQIASEVAQGRTADLTKAGGEYTISWYGGATGATVDNICVTAAKAGGVTSDPKGPSCPADAGTDD